jgi:hypothetical protein
MSVGVSKGVDLVTAVGTAVQGSQLGAANGVATLDANTTLTAAQIPSVVPQWVKTTLTFSSFSFAGSTNDVQAYLLPAGGVIHAVKIKQSASFTGGTISAYTVSVGISGNFTKYASAFDVFQSPSNTTFQLSNSFGSENHGVTTSIRAQAISTGDTLNNATTGSVDIWLLVSTAV